MQLSQFKAAARFRHAEQVKCHLRFTAMFLPVSVFTIAMRSHWPVLFHALLVVTGWCTWTYIEYALHRFWMHNKESHTALAHSHQHHHTHPTELVVNNFHRVGMVVVLTVLVVLARYLDNYFSFVVGFCLGLASYFLVHKMLHSRSAQKVFRRLVRYHIYHHCKYPDSCFGVSVPWWDDFFKTVPKPMAIHPRIAAFYFGEKTDVWQQPGCRRTDTGCFRKNQCGHCVNRH